LPDPGANPAHRSGKPVTNCFSYGAALISHLDRYNFHGRFFRR
jgi:hypothetical protein